MGFRDLWAATIGKVLERGRQRQTQPRVLGIPVNHVPGQPHASAYAASPERATGCSRCVRAPRPGENPADEWRVGSDDAGELHVLCWECSEGIVS